MSERNYPAPDINMETEAYFAAANDDKLLLKRCSDCCETHFFPRAICPHCLSSNTEWQEASGKGRIYSFSVMRRADPPYAIAYVTLEEGITMLTNIVEADFDSIAVDMPVEVSFRVTSDESQSIPVFRPVGG